MVTMTLRSWKRLLKLTSALASLGIAAIIAGALLLPLDVEMPTTVPTTESSNENPIVAAVQGGPLQDYAVIYQSKLLQTLVDPEPAAPPPPPPPPPPPAVVLEGTAIEPGFTMALLRPARGQAQWVSVGQKLEDVEVLEIRQDEVVLKHRGRSVTLKSASSEGGRP